MKNSPTKRYFILAILLLCQRPDPLVAQIFPVDVNTALIPPYSLTLADYALERSQDFMINITLNDPVETSLDIRLRLTISNNGTDILRTRSDFNPGFITLNQFATTSLTGLDIASYFNIDNLTTMNGYNFSGMLPEGLNSICIEVLSNNRPDIVVSNKACAFGYAVLNDPPYPQLPTCGETVEHIGAQNIMFVWLPMHLGSPNNVSSIEYEFTLVKVEDGYNAYEAMEGASILFQTTTTNTSLILQDPLLEDGHEYAWRVRVYDPFDGTVENLFKNNGISQVCTFYYEEHEFPDVSELYADELGSSCVSSCQADIPTNSNLVSTLATDDVIKVGKFLMTVTEVTSRSGDFFSGKGFIFIPFLLSNMNVTYTDLAVNTDGEAYSGDIITDIDSELVSTSMSDEDTDLSLTESEISNLNDYVNSEGRQVSKMDQGSSLGLPLALDKSIGGIDYNVIITGINFGLDAAYLNAAMSIQDAESGKGIPFGSKGICFHPFGIGGVGEAELYLLEDFSLGDYAEFPLTFKAPSDESSGTYLSFDCQGFVELNIEGEYEFPEDMLVTADNFGSPVKATFNINTTEWGQFITSLSMDEFEIHGLHGYTFSIQEAYLDFSDDGNPENMEFPEEYGDTSDDWKGFYLKSMYLTLPSELSENTGVLSFGTENVIIDHSGVTGDILGTGLLDLSDGMLGEWPFSIDTVRLSVVSNAMTEGALLGQIHVPIMDADNSLDYTGLIAPSDDGVDMQFNITPQEDIGVSMWAATLTLQNTSVISIAKNESGFTPYAELNGNLTLDVEIQPGNSFQVEALAFEGLKINHPDEDKRIVVDAFSLFGGGGGLSGDEEGEEDEQESFSGFPISLSNVAFESGSDGNEAGINFDLNLNLTGDDLGVAASTNLTITGVYNSSEAPFNAWKFKGVNFNSLEVDADLGAVSIIGSIVIYNSDETYGDGFKGMLQATFTPIGQMEAVAQFGKVDGYRYFFVDALMVTTSPIIDVLGLGLYGFGGGVYYHMRRDTEPPDLDIEGNSGFDDSRDPGVSLSGVTYLPDEDNLIGLKATMVAGVQPGGSSMSADLTFEVSFRKNNNFISISTISFDGDAYFMSPSMLRREESQVYAGIRATLDIDNQRLVASLDAYAEIAKGTITGNGQGAILLSKDDWYIYIGTPDNPITITVADVADFDMYFDMGTTVPSMPDLADKINGFSGRTTDQRPSSYLVSSGAAIIFGGSFKLDKKSYSFGSFYASAQFGMGFDAYLRKVTSNNCGAAKGTIGINGWYLSGQAYAFAKGDIGLKVKSWFYEGNVKILSLAGSMVMQAELPNPTWLYGLVHVQYKVLSGAVKGNIDYKFEIGSKCSFDNESLSDLKVITDIAPDDSETDVSVMTSPAIATSIPLNKSFNLSSIDKNGNTKNEYYMPVLQSFTLTSKTGSSIKTTPKVANNGNSAELYLSKLMEPNTKYTATASVKWKKKTGNNGGWSWVSGDAETESISFTTGALPDFLPNNAIAITKPMMNQRNTYQLSNEYFYVLTKQGGWSYLFEDQDFDYFLEIQDISGGEVKRKKVRYKDYNHGTGIIFSNESSEIQDFINNRRGKIFKASIMAIYGEKKRTDLSITSTDKKASTGVEVTTRSIQSQSTGHVDDKEIYQWYFRTSDYLKAIDKFNDLTLAKSYKQDYPKGSTVFTQSFFLTKSQEPFDKMDTEGYSWQGGNVAVSFPPTFDLVGLNWKGSTSNYISVWEREVDLARKRLNKVEFRSHYISSDREKKIRNKYLEDIIKYPKEVGHGAKLKWDYYQPWLTDKEKSTGISFGGNVNDNVTNESLFLTSDGDFLIMSMKESMKDLISHIRMTKSGKEFSDNYMHPTRSNIHGSGSGLMFEININESNKTQIKNLIFQ
ncbi:MAG: hypothetical protein GY816_19040 [Cytophagales bacterium]|nr:hypothetical protein [Cytophagales bacterium]